MVFFYAELIGAQHSDDAFVRRLISKKIAFESLIVEIESLSLLSLYRLTRKYEIFGKWLP
jgi:hypothetical protein